MGIEQGQWKPLIPVGVSPIRSVKHALQLLDAVSGTNRVSPASCSLGGHSELQERIQEQDNEVQAGFDGWMDMPNLAGCAVCRLG
jgi:hypothetical protein